MRSSMCVVALVILVLPGVQTFVPIGSGNTHVTITGNAVMKKIYEVCEAVAESEGRPFNPTGSSAEELLIACLGTATGQVSGAKFHEALNQIYMQNGLVDRDYVSSNPHHFNSEAFKEGHSLISKGVASVKANICRNNLQAARETLGRVLHTVQDFYSHTNWVELGNKNTYINIIKPDLTIDNVADVDTPTCRDCASGTCSKPLLPSILRKKKLTSGYMGLVSPNKPKGKCSHGGNDDLTSTQNPRGGISKDERRNHNAVLHDTAVALATDATAELLEDIRGAAGNKDFLRMMGIARTAVLCFVIDTTGSMSDDIAEAKRVAYKIIDSKKGTQDEPSEYILVPFNDPSFGPLIRTTNPDTMKTEISKLGANGGGDIPEMCLSGLQLALTGAPASSHIYVFTDATAKDSHLERTVMALIRSTKSTVSFFMTNNLRSARSLHTQGRSGFQVYYDLALASGGQAIAVSKASLPSATDIILDTSTSALVTILQRARNPGRVENFPFLLDMSLSNVTAYLTGNNLKFTLRSPSGTSQAHTENKGPLATIQTVGNLRRIHFDNLNETGKWHISMESTEPYTIKVTGQSPITFIYDFVEEFGGPHSGFAIIDGRPQKGLPAKLLLTMTGQKGAEALKLQEVTLVEVSNTKVANGVIAEMGGGDFLVTVNQVPEGEFVVMMKGEDMTTSSNFQRQTTTQMSQSQVTVNAVVNSVMVPGKDFSVPFMVTTDGTGGDFTISAKNDKNFPLAYNKKLTLNTGGNASSTVTVKPPASTESGTDVTLTILVEGPSGVDSNYAVLRLSVLTEVIDFTSPKCEIVGVSQHCHSLSNCSQSNWALSVNITDGSGSGIERVSTQQGTGNFSYETVVEGGITVMMGYYKASCCSPDVTVTAVDKEGNVGKCTYTVQKSGGVSLSLSLPLWVCLLVSTLSIMRDVLPL
ncbi:von Willebrand factor A domain-containing protein 7 [Neoarius graeffei]|uniref:von Willebrand factor A domain-containing protein 7 n=1 Tax=Neoarius graeffei TaxID=443677 RepID=UPI00298D0E43|nr:von Willebrand factor A domain-containing protein 7 [Neoarius graeffei]